MPKYRILSPVEHDHVRHEIGAVVEFTEAVAEPLLACRAIGPAKGKAAKPTGEGDQPPAGGSGEAGEGDPSPTGDPQPPAGGAGDQPTS